MTEPTTDADLNRIADAIVNVENAIKEEAAYEPGTPEHDGMHALRDLFSCTRILATEGLGAEPKDVAYLVSIVARLGDAIIRTDDDVREMREDSQRRADEIQQWSVDLAAADEFTVRITRADGQVVDVGPYPFVYIACQAKDYFQSCASSVEGARDARYTILPYDSGQPHRPGNIPAGAEALAALMGGDEGEPGDFPDLYHRLAARHAYSVAREAWDNATRVSDARI